MDKDINLKNKLWKIIEIFCELIFFIFPVKKNRVMFRSFAGQYNDNPKYISERLHEKDNKIEFIWIISDKCHERNRIPKYVKQVKDNTVIARYYKKTSKVLVENGLGWDMWFKHSFLYPIYKRKNQYNVSTWHGGLPFKHNGYDLDEFSMLNRNSGSTISDVVTLSNEFSRSMYMNAFFGNKLSFIESGTPRTDILFKNDNELRKKLLVKMHLSDKYNYVLYAPTYRDNVNDSGYNQMMEFNIKELLDAFNNRFGGNYKMILRAHNLVLDKLRTGRFIDNKYVFDGNILDDMNEYIYISDIIMTDYSGCMGDILLTKKPCFLYVNDIEKYNINRGQGGNYYMSINDFPDPKAMSFNELLDCIGKYDHDKIIVKRRKLLQKIGNYETGCATSIVTDLILRKIYEK